ncbi:transporter substrate-binding domain-containing protein [Fictibacillus sp. b24]|uniref:transporter substrate-binding domain-containing protein n=1 Tax=Fictibacillus sp. b24 TaxID=3055863 RepID=UPI0025A1EF39|nr:transporter substrate-binding domain-containing protein [Fictibacillus sp. b24]MDM5315412.1 transporter substrate-binding domain-containing protein [Fictibacillus sp. b24]
MKDFKKRISILAVVFSMFVLAACGSSESSDGGIELKKDGEFNFIVSGEFPPFSSVDSNGDLTGFDVAVGKAIADELGLKAVPEKFKFHGAVSAIKADRFDAAVASHTITEDRKQAVNFSEPYYYSGPVIFTRPDSDIKTKEDLKGKEVAVSKGSTYEKSAQDFTDQIKNYDSDATALRALSEGKHDAVITDAITGKQAIEKGFKIVEQEQLGTSEQAIAVKKEDKELLKAINKALKKMKDNGELEKLSKEYIGADITKKPE